MSNVMLVPGGAVEESQQAAHRAYQGLRIMIFIFMSLVIATIPLLAIAANNNDIVLGTSAIGFAPVVGVLFTYRNAWTSFDYARGLRDTRQRIIITILMAIITWIYFILQLDKVVDICIPGPVSFEDQIKCSVPLGNYGVLVATICFAGAFGLAMFILAGCDLVFHNKVKHLEDLKESFKAKEDL